jgi:hypothetical protein
VSVPDVNVPDTSVTATKPGQAEILVTEVMFNPSTTEPDTEWLEVYNAATGPRSLNGLTLADGSGHSESIAASPAVVVQPGAYAVLARSKASATAAGVPAAAILYEYATLTLANGSTGLVTLSDGATTIAQSPFGTFGMSVSGESIQLKTLTYADESKSASWCLSTIPWATGSDKGTPGAAQKCQ